MIFNNDSYAATSYDVKPSPFEPTIEGALMHVYENACNYNALMKAVGLAEMKYYQETGKELFLNEAGAFSGFIDKLKAFFKKVIEKIKSIFHKFMAVINQYRMTDEKFLKEYSSEIRRKNLKDFEYNGWTFKDLNAVVTAVNGKTTIANYADVVKTVIGGGTAAAFADDLAKSFAAGTVPKFETGYDNAGTGDQTATKAEEFLTSDKKDEIVEAMRGKMLDSNGSNKYTSSEFIEELKKKCYGDGKEKFDVKIDDWLGYISNAKEDIKAAEKAQKDITKAIERLIKNIDSEEKEINKKISAGGSNADADKYKFKVLSATGDLYRHFSDILTTYYGTMVQALKDRNRQAKAICVKALSYKAESASYGYTESYSYDNNDLFGFSFK